MFHPLHPPPSKSKYCRWIIWYHIQNIFATFPPSQKVHFRSISSSSGVNCIICPPHIKVHHVLSALEYKLYTSLYHTKVKNAKIYAISPFLQDSLFYFQIRFDFSLPPPLLESAQNIYSYTCYSKNRDKRFYEDFFPRKLKIHSVFFHPERRE